MIVTATINLRAAASREQSDSDCCTSIGNFHVSRLVCSCPASSLLGDTQTRLTSTLSQTN